MFHRLGASLFRRLLVALLGVMALAWGVWVFTTPGLRPVVISLYDPPTLQVVPSRVDLGIIPTDSKAETTLMVYNVGGQPLKLHSVEASCGCTVAKLSRQTLPPGDVARLNVSLDTSIKLGKVRKRVEIRSNDPRHPLTKVYLTGNVVAQMKGHPRMTVKDPLVLFKGQCATCHVMQGRGKTGKSLFLADCAMCHGSQGQGGVAPGLITRNYEDAKVQAAMRAIIADGSPNSPEMPPYHQRHGGPLNDAEIDSLVNFLTFQAAEAKAGRLNPPDDVDEEE